MEVYYFEGLLSLYQDNIPVAACHLLDGFDYNTSFVRRPGRTLAQDIAAEEYVPDFDRSTVDDYAVRAKDTFGATETTPVTLSADQYIVLDTGDPIPEGCDAVIMVEDIVKNGDGTITIHAAAAPWQHIRQIGEDICAGEMILPSHMPIYPAAIGAMIAGGVLEIEVIRKPVVGIIPTGDEIIPPCTDPKPGDILEFNGSIFSAWSASGGLMRRCTPSSPTFSTGSKPPWPRPPTSATW